MSRVQCMTCVRSSCIMCIKFSWQISYAVLMWTGEQEDWRDKGTQQLNFENALHSKLSFAWVWTSDVRGKSFWYFSLLTDQFKDDLHWFLLTTKSTKSKIFSRSWQCSYQIIYIHNRDIILKMFITLNKTCDSLVR